MALVGHAALEDGRRAVRAADHDAAALIEYGGVDDNLLSARLLRAEGQKHRMHENRPEQQDHERVRDLLPANEHDKLENLLKHPKHHAEHHRPAVYEVYKHAKDYKQGDIDI
jgi:hypothetical protein